MSHRAVLRKVGGSVMLALPPALLDVVALSAGRHVALTVEDGRIVVAPRPRARYTMAELLAQCDADAPLSDEDREWVDTRPVGNELL
jgi:antitoxin ChpS